MPVRPRRFVTSPHPAAALKEYEQSVRIERNRFRSLGTARATDGKLITREYHTGDTSYSEHTPDEPGIHDLENAGDGPIRFVTVELLD